MVSWGGQKARNVASDPLVSLVGRRATDQREERITAGRTCDARDGHELNLYELATRAANAAIMRAYREQHDTRTTPAEITTEDGERITRPDLYRYDARGAPRTPAERTEDADTIQHIFAALPRSYAKDAPSVIAWTAAGYTAGEIAERMRCSSRRIERILKAARDAAERI